jgi:hypothetical protein
MQHLSCSSSYSYIVIISFLIYKIMFEISLNICMMFNNIESKHGKLVFSSTDPKGQVRYYHSVSSPLLHNFSHSHYIFFLETAKPDTFTILSYRVLEIFTLHAYRTCSCKTHMNLLMTCLNPKGL